MTIEEFRNEYFTQEECAEALGLAPITLAQWRMKRFGPPCSRIGRRVVYKKSSVKAWLDAQERPSGTINPALAVTA